MKKNVTIKEIAQKTGFSVPTVSLALNDKASSVGLREETCRRIQKAAAELGYRPNAYRMVVHTGRFQCATLLLSSEGRRSFMPIGLLLGIQDELAVRNMHLTLAKLPDEKLVESGFIPRFLQEWMSDGLLINYTHNIPAAMEEIIVRCRIPAIWINSKHPFDCIHPDDHGGAGAGVDSLLTLGHRRIAYLQRGGEHYSHDDRRNGYRAAMLAAGLPHNILPGYGGLSGPGRIAAGRELLSRADRPTAVIAYAPQDAGALLTAAFQLGLAVPQDLSILTFADWHPEGTGLLISYLQISAHRLGEEAIKMLCHKIEQPAEPLPAQVFPLRLIEGETIGLAPQP